LLGHWPLSGRGSGDRYLVYGNLFLDNPSEALLQAEGNVVLYNNVFVNRDGDGVMLREHNSVPRAIDMFRNTILVRGTGLLLRNPDPLAVQTLEANAIFAANVAPAVAAKANLTRSFAEAQHLLRNAGERAGMLDLAPVDHFLDDYHWNSESRGALPDIELDFDRKLRRRATMGAYAPDVPAEPARFRLPTPIPGAKKPSTDNAIR
jgi:hypothetical protein